MGFSLWNIYTFGIRLPTRTAYGARELGPLRPLRGSGFALGQPDAFGAGESAHDHFS